VIKLQDLDNDGVLMTLSQDHLLKRRENENRKINQMMNTDSNAKKPSRMKVLKKRLNLYKPINIVVVPVIHCII
jgi:hypothetical protein